ncbi:MAG: tRNA lysidine(34) synthetase TilS [bacterium]
MGHTNENNQISIGDSLKRFLAEGNSISEGSTLLLAVSGGIDSMVMLQLFVDIRTTYPFHLRIAHINHLLRGTESDQDEVFVRRIAKELSVPYYLKRVDVNSFAAQRNLSKQEAARALRYQALEELRLESASDFILTAHHADDNAETVLMNVIRGTGIRGLAGIPDYVPTRKIVRPLLHVSREQIEAYASVHGVQYREDSSNPSLEYRRNKVRLSLLPEIRKNYNPEINTVLNRLSETMKHLRSWVDAEVESRFGNVVAADGNEFRLNIVRFSAEPLYLQNEIILELLRRLKIEPAHEKVHALLDLSCSQSGRSLHLSPEVIVWKDRDSLLFQRRNEYPAYELSIESGAVIECEHFSFSISQETALPVSYSESTLIEDIDAAKLGSRLILRTWREGDWFIPLGMQEKKKLSDFFIDQKIPSSKKSEIPIFESDGSIVWVCGQRIDNRFRITEKTQKTVRLQFSPHNHS